MKKIFTLVIFTIIAISNSFAQDATYQKHDIRVGTGLFFDFSTRYASTNQGAELRVNIKNGLNYYLSYNYKFSKQWKAAANFAYHNEAGMDVTAFRISPGVAFEWYNKGTLTLYSEVGATFKSTNFKRISNGESVSVTDNTFNVYGVPLGIMYGKNVYFSAELFAFGPKGFFNIGIGYKF